MRLLSSDDIPEILRAMKEETKALKRDLAHIQWHMKGMGLAEVYAMSALDRKLYAEVIAENVEKFAKATI